MSVDAPRLKNCALFFDFDGTLAHIVDNPASVSISPGVRSALEKLHEMTGGALAIVSGRAIGDIDRFLAPMHMDASGVHGLERRVGHGTIERAPIDKAAFRQLLGRVRNFVADAPEGVMAEEKPGSVAIHYRMAPEFEANSRAFGDEIVREIAGVTAMRGKMVVELRLGGRSKGDAIAHFMDQPGYRGRTPLFFGDDVTDEDGFAALAAHKGLGFKIGPGDTGADFRFATIEEFHSWLEEIANEGGTFDPWSAGGPRVLAQAAEARTGVRQISEAGATR